MAIGWSGRSGAAGYQQTVSLPWLWDGGLCLVASTLGVRSPAVLVVAQLPTTGESTSSSLAARRGLPACDRLGKGWGYTGVLTSAQDLTGQRDRLAVLGVEVDRVYVCAGLTGTDRDRPRSRGEGGVPGAGTMVVADRFARSWRVAQSSLWRSG